MADEEKKPEKVTTQEQIGAILGSTFRKLKGSGFGQKHVQPIVDAYVQGKEEAAASAAAEEQARKKQGETDADV